MSRISPATVPALQQPSKCCIAASKVARQKPSAPLLLSSHMTFTRERRRAGRGMRLWKGRREKDTGDKRRIRRDMGVYSALHERDEKGDTVSIVTAVTDHAFTQRDHRGRNDRQFSKQNGHHCKRRMLLYSRSFSSARRPPLLLPRIFVHSSIHPFIHSSIQPYL